MCSENTEFLPYTHNVLAMCFQFPKLGTLQRRRKYILNEPIRKVLVELGQYIADGPKMSQFGM
jgi:hypothetical protein